MAGALFARLSRSRALGVAALSVLIMCLLLCRHCGRLEGRPVYEPLGPDALSWASKVTPQGICHLTWHFLEGVWRKLDFRAALSTFIIVLCYVKGDQLHALLLRLWFSETFAEWAPGLGWARGQNGADLPELENLTGVDGSDEPWGEGACSNQPPEVHARQGVPRVRRRHVVGMNCAAKRGCGVAAGVEMGGDVERKGRGDSELTPLPASSKRNVPDCWLVFDPIWGIVPYEVAERWSSATRRYDEATGCCGPGKSLGSTAGMPRKGTEDVSTDDNKVSGAAGEGSVPPVRGGGPPRVKTAAVITACA